MLYETCNYSVTLILIIFFQINLRIDIIIIYNVDKNDDNENTKNFFELTW